MKVNVSYSFRLYLHLTPIYSKISIHSEPFSQPKCWGQTDDREGMNSDVLRNTGGGVQEVLRWCYSLQGEGRGHFSQNLRYVIWPLIADKNRN